jgi:hypothetical protein
LQMWCQCYKNTYFHYFLHADDILYDTWK